MSKVKDNTVTVVLPITLAGLSSTTQDKAAGLISDNQIKASIARFLTMSSLTICCNVRIMPE